MGKKSGFTIIEILLFLAIAGALVAGVIASTVAPISRQRYNTGVDVFVDFLEGIYSSVTSVQNVSGNGRSNIIVYGKLVTYGEPDDIEDGGGENHTFHVYDIVGDVYDSSNPLFSSTLSVIKDLHGCIYAPVITDAGDKNFCSTPKTAGTEIQFTNEDIFISNLSIENGYDGHIPASGAFMVIRSPSGGAINTYTTTGYEKSNQNFWRKDGGFATPSRALEDITIDAKNYFTNLITSHLNKIEDINFCLYSSDMHYATSSRRNVRIMAGANNSSGVRLIATDDLAEGSSICQN